MRAARDTPSFIIHLRPDDSGGTLATKLENVLKTIRDDLGQIRSCALMMAHAQSRDVRTGYLKTLNEKVSALEDRLARLSELVPPQ